MILLKRNIKKLIEKNGIILSVKLILGGAYMKKEEILSLLESESIIEEQGLKSSYSRLVNVGRLDGIVYDPSNHDNPIGMPPGRRW